MKYPNQNNTETNILNHALDSGIIDLAYLSEQCEKLNRKGILKNYNYWYNQKKKAWLWYEPNPTAKSNRRQIKRKKKEDMEQYIIEHHLSNHDMKLKSSPTVNNVFDEYVAMTKKHKSILITTLNRYKNYFNKFIGADRIADKEIGSVTERDIKKLLDGVIKGKTGDDRITKKSFNEIKSIINNIFSFAKTEMDIDCISTKTYMADLKYNKRHFKVPKKLNEECVYLEQEVIVIKDYVIGRYQDGTVTTRELGILFCFMSGLRAGELACLKSTDLIGNVLHISRHLTRDENARYIMIDGAKEGEEAKQVVLSDNALTVWKCLRKVNMKNGNPTDFIFCDERMPINKHLVTHHFDTTLRHICEEVKIPFRSCHKMRATYI